MCNFPLTSKYDPLIYGLVCLLNNTTFDLAMFTYHVYQLNKFKSKYNHNRVIGVPHWPRFLRVIFKQIRDQSLLR